MIIMMPQWLDRSVVVTVYGFALLKGGKPERALASVFAAVWAWHVFFHPLTYGHERLHVLSVDIALGFVTVSLALRYDRWWLLVTAMAYVLRVATDSVALLIPVDGWALGTALFIWSYIQLAALATGTWTSWRRRCAPSPLAIA